MNVEAFERHFRSTFGTFVGSKIVVALSGGADSVALLHLLRRSELDLELVAAHIHHGTRGPEADGDAAFCEQLCAEFDISFVLRRLTGISPGPEGRESTWRQARYEALRSIASACDADAIATGHQSDDIAEGVLVQLLRGAGPRAMAGISAIQDGVIRPLLPWSHDAICSWLRDHGASWREDTSNASPDHLRNRVRHEALPCLEEISHPARRHLIHLARSLAADEAYLKSRLEAHAQWIDPWHPRGGVAIDVIANLDPALQVRWLHALAHRSAIGRITRRQIELLPSILDGKIRAVTLAGRWVLRSAGSRLWLEPPSQPPPYELDLEPGETLPLPIPGWAASYRPASTPTTSGLWVYRCEPAQRLTLRSPRRGDRFADGSSVHRTLKSALPRHLRGSWPILCGGAKILWIPGVEHDTGSSTGEWIVEVMRT